MNRLLSLLSICFLLVSTQAFAKHKKIEKTFKAVDNLKIEAKYGKLQIKPWDKNEIHFDILVQVDGSNEDKNQTTLDNINIDFTKGDQQIVAQTVLGDFFTFKKLTNSLFHKSKIKITYTVQIPAGTSLELVQKNGDIFMDSHEGDLSVDLSGGNFTAQDIKGESNFKLGNVKFKANDLANAKVEIAGSEIRIENAGKISGESRDSEYNIQVIDNLNIQSTRDKFEIKEIEYLYGASSFSKFEISQMGGEIDYELKFGHINIFNINNMFSFIKLDSKYGDIGLSFMDGCQMDYEINHKSVKFDNSNAFTLTNEKTADKKTFVSKGKIGDKKAFSNLKIRANNCKIRLQ